VILKGRQYQFQVRAQGTRNTRPSASDGAGVFSYFVVAIAIAMSVSSENTDN
jgi:hypothetical protein